MWMAPLCALVPPHVGDFANGWALDILFARIRNFPSGWFDWYPNHAAKACGVRVPVRGSRYLLLPPTEALAPIAADAPAVARHSAAREADADAVLEVPAAACEGDRTRNRVLWSSEAASSSRVSSRVPAMIWSC